MEEEEEEDQENYRVIPQSDWFIKLLSFQADVIYSFIVMLLSPFILVFSMIFESYRRTVEDASTIESAVLKLPSKVARRSIVLVRKIGLGVIGALNVLFVSTSVMALAGVLGFGLVHLWTEKPVFLREKLFFDYTDANPKAEFSFEGVDGFGIFKRGQMGVPVGHTFHVSLKLLMPESDYNREVGIFQLTAELSSASGIVITNSSQPCMLPFRSLPIRLLGTFLRSVPLVLGVSEETRAISVDVLKHKEGYPRTKTLRVTLSPRAGTSYLPQIYEAQLIMNSQLPWTKQLLHNWKWSISAWATLYIYIVLLMILTYCCRSLLFSVTMMNFNDRVGSKEDSSIEESKAEDLSTKEPKATKEDSSTNESKAEDLNTKEPKATLMHTEPTDERERATSDFVKQWQQRKKKRKAIFLQREMSDIVDSSASSMSIIRPDTSALEGVDIGDSESVCLDD